MNNEYSNKRNHIKSSDQDKLYSLDGLKLICALIIALIWHYQHFQSEFHPFYRVFRPFYDYGLYAVEVFFMLSGFGMVLGYMDKIIEEKISCASYWKRRVRKIFPIMIFSTILVAVLQSVLLKMTGDILQYPIETFDLYHLWLNIIGMQYGVLGTDFSYNAPTWFVGVLFVCYLLFFMICFTNRKSREVISCWFMVMIGIGMSMIIINGEFPIYNASIGRGLASFFIGTLIAMLYKRRDRINVSLLGYVGLTLLVITTVMAIFGGYAYIGNMQLFVIMCLSPCIIFAILFIPYLNWAFSYLGKAKIARLSLEIFMLHFPVQCIWKIIEKDTRMNWNYSSKLIWIMYGISVILSAYIYRLFFKKRVDSIFDRVFVNE